MLFLIRSTDQFSLLGKAIIGAGYTADGKDTKGVQAFIANVIVGGRDEKRTTCEEEFRKYLDYYLDLGKLASISIYETIAKQVNTVL